MEACELYLHVPFCLRKCRYCDFLSFPAAEETQKKYLEVLAGEIRRTAPAERIDVRSVFFGGGTPSLLPGEAIAELMETVREHFRLLPSAEVTLEANPGTFDRSKAEKWLAAGVNRISMGVQSFDDALLARLGRIHDAETARRQFALLREGGFRNLSMDLMMGLPGQTAGTWERTLREAVSLGPEHLSCYSLIVEEGTPFFAEQEAGALELPSEEEERAMYGFTCDFLAGQGFAQYEISNFARPGYESVQNSGYWQRVPYFGFGLGAASLVLGEEGERRYSNVRELRSYLGSAGNPSLLHTEEELLSDTDREEEFMFLGLRMNEGVNAERFRETFGVSLGEVYGKALRDNIGKGLMEEADGRFRLTARGRDLGNLVFGSFLQ